MSTDRTPATAAAPPSEGADPSDSWQPDARRGTVRPIRELGDPVLRSTAEHVMAFDDGLRRLLDDMFASMYAADGVGLAANQIGVGYDVFVYDCPLDEDDPGDPDDPSNHGIGYVVNPVLVETWGDELVWGEGCLSLPRFSRDTPRPACAAVEGLDAEGRRVRVEGSGQLGRCLQHESDHLIGKVYLDRLPRRERGRALRAYLDQA